MRRNYVVVTALDIIGHKKPFRYVVQELSDQQNEYEQGDGQPFYTPIRIKFQFWDKPVPKQYTLLLQAGKWLFQPK